MSSNPITINTSVVNQLDSHWIIALLFFIAVICFWNGWKTTNNGMFVVIHTGKPPLRPDPSHVLGLPVVNLSKDGAVSSTTINSNHACTLVKLTSAIATVAYSPLPAMREVCIHAFKADGYDFKPVKIQDFDPLGIRLTNAEFKDFTAKTANTTKTFMWTNGDGIFVLFVVYHMCPADQKAKRVFKCLNDKLNEMKFGQFEGMANQIKAMGLQIILTIIIAVFVKHFM